MFSFYVVHTILNWLENLGFRKLGAFQNFFSKLQTSKVLVLMTTINFKIFLFYTDYTVVNWLQNLHNSQKLGAFYNFWLITSKVLILNFKILFYENNKFLIRF